MGYLFTQTTPFHMLGHMVPTTVFNSSSRGGKCCVCMLLWVCMCICVMSSWGCQSLLYDTTLFLWNMVSPWIWSRVHVFQWDWHSVGPSGLWALQCWNYKHARDYSQCSVVLESEVWFLYLCIVHSNHGAISPTKSLWLENTLYFCLLH